MLISAGNALSLIRAVLDLNGDRRTGVLDVVAEGVRTRIYFEDGRPLFAEDGAPGETSAEHVCGIITRALRREQSQWTFDPSPAAAKPPRSFSLEINPAILEAMRRSPDGSAGAAAVAAGSDAIVVIAAGARVPDGMTAEHAFQKGVALLRAAQTASAAIELRRASELRPESLPYLLYATWAEARSRSDVPSEPDQRTLLDIAQRAKKHDPLFAFASYVIGQLSMWAGDDATAKKWFYEALRLDGTSEAGTQVRILARRGNGPSGLSGLWKLPDADPTAERAPVPVSAPPVQPTTKSGGPPPIPIAALEVQATKGVQPRAAPPSRWTERRLVPVAVLLSMAGFVIVFIAMKSGPKAGMAPSPFVQPAPSVSVAPPVAQEPRAPSPPPAVPGEGASATDPAPEKESPGSVTEKAPDDGQKGTVLFPSRAAGHRIFVDGRRADTDGSAPLRLLCGPHEIQIGGHGTPEHIDVPCRGAIQLE